jgi:hypothetical protein
MRELVFNGKIDDASAPQLIAAFDRGIRTLVITSGGGTPEASLRVAESILRHRVDVVVRGICFSACASYVFVAGSNRRVEDGALLGFHHTSGSLGEAMRVHHRSTETDIVLAWAEREKAIYRARGIDERLLYYPHYLLLPFCYQVREKQRENQDGFIVYSDHQMFFPSTRTATAMGLRFAGRLVESHAQFAQSWRENTGGRGAPIRAVLDLNSTRTIPSLDELRVPLRVLENCPNNMPPVRHTLLKR